MLNKSHPMTTAKKDIPGLPDSHDLFIRENGVLLNTATSRPLPKKPSFDNFNIETYVLYF